jgi:hypothetical protein
MDTPYQINYAVKFGGPMGDKIIEKSLLINIRGEQLPVVVANFQTLRSRLNGDLAGATLPKLPDARPNIMVLEPQEEQQSNYPGNCERCGAAMVLKVARKGPHAGQQFWACCAYSKGCLSTKPA